MNHLLALISSFWWAHLLISLNLNERLWAIGSDHSRQMSDQEQIAQVPQRKWATVSNLLTSLRGNERCEQIAHFAHQQWVNEWISHFFEWIAHSLIRSEIKWANSQPCQKGGQGKEGYFFFYGTFTVKHTEFCMPVLVSYIWDCIFHNLGRDETRHHCHHLGAANVSPHTEIDYWG